MKDLYLFVVISAANHLSFTGARLAVILYAVHLEASPAVVGVLAALFGLLPCFTSVYVGRLMDRVGPRWPMVWCSVLMTVGALAGVLPSQGAPALVNVTALGIVATFVGSCYSFFFLGHTQWIGRIGRPEDRTRNFALASIGFSIAAFLGPMLVGFMVDTVGYRTAFVALALVPFLPLAVIASGVIQPPPREQRAAGAGKRRSGGVLELARNRDLVRIFGVSVLAYATFSVIHFLVPVHGARVGLSASSIGIIMGSYSIASIVIRAFMTALSRRFTNWQLMLASLFVPAVCLLLFPFLGNPAALTVLAFVVGLGTGLSGPLSQALLYDASPPERVGEVMGLRVSALNLDQTFVPMIAGAIGAAVGVGPVFWGMALLLFGGTFAARSQWRRPHAPSDR